MKIYTKTGDAGTTGLFGGKRVDKDDLRVVAYGTVDEMNAGLGLALSACHHGPMKAQLTTIQSRLFEIGADLATPYVEGEETSKRYVPRVDPGHVKELEDAIDEVMGELPEMKHFILPGGTELAGRLHLCRTICRRAERLVVTLGKHEPVNSDVVVYLNRLSDYLFAMARQANALEGVEDTPWIAPR